MDVLPNRTGKRNQSTSIWCDYWWKFRLWLLHVHDDGFITIGVENNNQITFRIWNCYCSCKLFNGNIPLREQHDPECSTSGECTQLLDVTPRNCRITFTHSTFSCRSSKIAKQTLKVLLTRYFWKWEREKGRGGVEGKSGGGGSKEVGEIKVGKYSYIKSQNTAGIGF